MYLTNTARLALHLEGYPDAPLSVVQAAVTATGYTGYVAPDYKAPAPPAPPAKQTTGGGGTTPGASAKR
jgi:hypothetical protein